MSTSSSNISPSVTTISTHKHIDEDLYSRQVSIYISTFYVP